MIIIKDSLEVDYVKERLEETDSYFVYLQQTDNWHGSSKQSD